MTRKTISTGVVLVAALLVAGCATRPPPQSWTETRYDCSETLNTADGQLVAWENGLRWIQDLNDGVMIETTVSLHSAELQERFAALGFDGIGPDQPRFVVNYGSRHSIRNYWRDGGPHFEVVSEIRLGAQFERDWLRHNQVLSWPTARNWMTAEPEGGFVFTVYDTAGVQLQRATLSRQAFERVQQRLKALHARVVEKAAARESLCRATTYEGPEEIVIT